MMKKIKPEFLLYASITLIIMALMAGLFYTYAPGGEEDLFDSQAWSVEAVEAFLVAEEIDTEGVDIVQEYDFFVDAIEIIFAEKRCQEDSVQLAYLIDKQAVKRAVKPEDSLLMRYKIATILNHSVQAGDLFDCEAWLHNEKYLPELQGDGE